MILSIKNRLLAFSAIFILIPTIAWLIIHSRVFHGNEAIFSIGMTIDIAIVIPVAYFLLIRKSSIPPFSVVFIFLAGLFLASNLIPVANQEFLNHLKLAVPLVELALLSLLIQKISRIVKQQRISTGSGIDFVESLRDVLFKNLGNRTAANIMTTEASMFYFLIRGWKKDDSDSSEKSFTCHRKSSYAVIVWTFVFLIIIESFAVHLVLSKLNVTLAWVVTALSIYGVLFFVGDFNAIRRRTIYFDDEHLHLRTGIRWFSKIPVTEIDRVELTRISEKSNSNLNLVLFGDPNVKIVFKSPQSAIGLYGITRQFSCAFLFLDEKALFMDEIERRIERDRQLNM